MMDRLPHARTLRERRARGDSGKKSKSAEYFGDCSGHWSGFSIRTGETLPVTFPHRTTRAWELRSGIQGNVLPRDARPRGAQLIGDLTWKLQMSSKHSRSFEVAERFRDSGFPRHSKRRKGP